MRKIGTVLMTLAACLVILEFGLRAVGRGPTNMADGTAEQDGDSFRLKKNSTKVIKYPAYTYTMITNEFGFRDRSTGPRDLRGKPFYAFLGASDVFGNGVEYEDSFVGIFDDAARSKGFEVLNLAVGGHFFLDGEDLLKRFIRETGYKPATVVFCANALHIPVFDRRNKNVIVRSGYPMERQNWRLTYIRLLAGNVSSAFCFFRDAVRRIQERYLDYEAISKSPPEFIKAFSKANPIRDPERIRAFEAYLSGFEAFCRDNGIGLVYVYLPLSDSFKLPEMLAQLGADPEDYDATFYEDLMREHCEKAGIKLVDPTPALEREHEAGRELRFKLDPHFNRSANRVIGDYLARELLSSPAPAF